MRGCVGVDSAGEILTGVCSSIDKGVFGGV